jgi:hypothetical protein
MPHGGNFNPEWGYLAPKPGFIRTVRAVLLAGVIGTVAGMAVAVALVARPAADVSVAARTMAQPSERTVAQPGMSDPSPKSASANDEVSQNGAQHAAPSPLSASSGVDRQDLKNFEAAESHPAATIQQHTSIAALAEAPEVSGNNNTTDVSGGALRPSPPRTVSRVQQPTNVAALAESPAWRDDASQMSGEAAPVPPPPKKMNRKAQAVRVHTPPNDVNFVEHKNGGGPLDFLPMIGRTILGANPFWNDQVR